MARNLGIIVRNNTSAFHLKKLLKNVYEVMLHTYKYLHRNNTLIYTLAKIVCIPLAGFHAMLSSFVRLVDFFFTVDDGRERS